MGYASNRSCLLYPFVKIVESNHNFFEWLVEIKIAVWVAREYYEDDVLISFGRWVQILYETLSLRPSWWFKRFPPPPHTHMSYLDPVRSWRIPLQMLCSVCLFCVDNVFHKSLMPDKYTIHRTTHSILVLFYLSAIDIWQTIIFRLRSICRCPWSLNS